MITQTMEPRKILFKEGQTIHLLDVKFCVGQGITRNILKDMQKSQKSEVVSKDRMKL